MLKQIKEKAKQFYQRYPKRAQDEIVQFLDKHPKLARSGEITAKVALGTATVGGSLVVGFVAFACAVGWFVSRDRQDEFKPDPRKATLIAKNMHEHGVDLAMDLDGNINTAEALVFCNKTCPREAANLLVVQPGTTKTVQEWKKFLRDECWERHYRWQEMKRE